MLDNEVLSKEFLGKLLQSMRDLGAGQTLPGGNDELVAPVREFMALLEAAAADDAPPLTRKELHEAKMKLREALRARFTEQPGV